MINTLREKVKIIVPFEMWVVSLGVFLSVIFPQILLGVVIVGVTFWGLRFLAFGYFNHRTPADFGILVIIFMIPITVWATAIPTKTLALAYRLLIGVLLYYAIVNWANTEQRLLFSVLGVSLMGLALGIYGLISVDWTFEKLRIIPTSVYDYIPLLVEDTVHRNVMAGNLVILLPIALSIPFFAWKEMRVRERSFFIVVILSMTGMLVLTQSRGSLISFGGVVITLIALRWRYGWLSLPVSIFSSLVIIQITGVKAVLDFLSSGVSLTGLEGRLEIWSRALQIIQNFGFTGVGMGNFGIVVDTLFPPFLNAPAIIDHAHNLFLQVAVDLGIPGFIGWSSILIVVIICSCQVFRKGRLLQNGWVSGLGAGLLSSQIALIVHGLVDAVTWGMVRPAPIVWGLWGLATASWSVYFWATKENHRSLAN